MKRHSKQSSKARLTHAAIETWGDMVLRLALCRMQNHYDAEDVFQLVFMKFYEYQGALNDEEHMRAWLLRVTINCCNDLHRKARLSKHISLDQSTEVPASKKQKSSPLDEEIDRLPDKQRVVIHLHYFEGYSTDEIAHITQENPSTVRSRLRRARQSLKLALGGSDEERRISREVSRTTAYDKRF